MSSAVWKTIETATSDDGHSIEMRLANFGKGQHVVMKFEFFRDGVKVGYAVNYTDAAENWSRVRAGMIRDANSGQWRSATCED